MNICFLMGKIISNIEFKFIVNNKKYRSIVIFQIELVNKSKVTIKGYNEIADYCYRNLNQGKYCIIEGKITGNKAKKFKSEIEELFEIEINSIKTII